MGLGNSHKKNKLEKDAFTFSKYAKIKGVAKSDILTQKRSLLR